MTALKIAVSLPPDAVARARVAVKEGRAASVSAYVAAALEEKAKHEDLRRMLDEMLAETGGPPTAAERRWADHALELGAVAPARVRAAKKKQRRRASR